MIDESDSDSVSVERAGEDLLAVPDDVPGQVPVNILNAFRMGFLKQRTDGWLPDNAGQDNMASRQKPGITDEIFR